LKSFNSLLFELSSSDRLDVLTLLKKTPLKLSHISSKLDFTVQETSRNITRLSEAKLVRKDADGAFHLTPYGEEALNLLLGFRFLFKNRDYFNGHTLSQFPSQFRASLGILDSFQFVSDVMVSFHNIEKMIAKAEKFVWILTNQVLVSTIPYLVQEIERGGEFRLLMPKDYSPTKEMRDLVTNPVFAKAARTNKLEMKFLDKVDVCLCLSEKEVSLLSFPNLEDRLDYLGFRGEEEPALEWAKLLYLHYWNKATSQIPDQLIGK
jgi:predicted transcriptional regulator